MYFVGFDFLTYTQLRYFESPHYLWLVTELCHGEECDGCLPLSSPHGWIGAGIPMASMALHGPLDGHQELCERIISEQRGLPETEVMGPWVHGWVAGR